MTLSLLDYLVFGLFIVVVVGTGLWQSRKEANAEDYFLAGRGLSWWVIGLSLIASNISTEHFIGMAGQGYQEGIGMAIASYEWIAAVALVLVAFFLLPRFLKAGLYTMPEFLEYRYNRSVRTLMSGITLVFYVGITMATVLLLGALPLEVIFGLPRQQGIWLIGLLAGAYTVYGGLKAVVWTDVLQASALLFGGMLVSVLAIQETGGWTSFQTLAGDRLDAVLPADHPKYPWPAIFLGGMWIPNLYYWGLNQFITQRTLGAKSIREGQKGILFGASMKLLIPLIVVLPGIAAFVLYADEIGGNMDAAYPTLLKNILPAGLAGLMLAALFGAVMSTLDSLLNSSATLFTMDLYKPFINPGADDRTLMRTGRWSTLVFVLVACLWTPVVGSFDGGLYEFIQLYWGFVQPGILAVFLFGLVWSRVPAAAALAGMLLNIPLYGLLLWQFPNIAFLHHMGICFVVILAVMAAITAIRPLRIPAVLPDHAHAGQQHSGPWLKAWGIAIVLATAALYAYFS
ncbi:MAG: solute:sodium symporter family transporter [Bacteroidetes bacterium]|nr:solute:sodium symporter family transporter [Bacteroidota bacterium]